MLRQHAELSGGKSTDVCSFPIYMKQNIGMVDESRDRRWENTNGKILTVEASWWVYWFCKILPTSHVWKFQSEITRIIIFHLITLHYPLSIWVCANLYPFQQLLKILFMLNCVPQFINPRSRTFRLLCKDRITVNIWVTVSERLC